MGSDNPITFIKQSIRDFKNTGALAPSGAFLARAIAKCLPEQTDNDYRILEVGPGTGAVTGEIVKKMDGDGHLDLWEISPAFCTHLRKRIAQEKAFVRMNSRIDVHEGDVRDLEAKPRYDAIIAGLPFTNFEPPEVQGFLEHFQALLKPNGALIWFEYVAIRKIQSPFVSKARREKLKRVGDVTARFIRAHQFKQQIIPINIPPARIRLLRFG